MHNKSLIANELKKLKGKHLITYEEWSKRFGIPVGAMFEWCDIYGVSIDEVFGKRPVQHDVLCISKPSGNETTDELRKQMHDPIDWLED